MGANPGDQRLGPGRRIVERHRGSITARSAPGAGATFEVTLLARQPAATDQPIKRQEAVS